MRTQYIVALFLSLGLLFFASETIAESSSVEVELNIASDGETASLSATAFGMSLAAWVSENEDVDALPEGVYSLTPEALYSALSSQIQIWRELRGQGGLPYTYLDELIQVDDEGYLLGYVWFFHKTDQWKKPSTELMMESFATWADSSISEHQPRLEAQLRIARK